MMTLTEAITAFLSVAAIVVSLVTLYYTSIRRTRGLTISMTSSSLGYTGSASYADVVLVNTGNQPLAVKDIVLIMNGRSVSPIDYNLRNIEPGTIQVVRLDVQLMDLFDEAKRVFASSNIQSVDFECVLEMVVFDTTGDERSVKLAPGTLTVTVGGGHGYRKDAADHKIRMKW